MYQVLYRKWRSPTFADVVGQPHVTRTLRHALCANHLAHAYLFTGPRGTGKTSCARLLARAANCLAPVDGEPCNACELCTGILAGSILDVIEIDAASNNGVDNIRDLREETNFTPSQGKYRVYIIDEVHMLSPGAFNALLKTLEEPPGYVLFILATTEVHKLPATVLSRCQRFDFHRIPPECIAERLTFIAEQEGLTLAPAAALLLARVADGAMRDALSLLDRCRADGDVITADSAAHCIGLADGQHLFALMDALLAQEIPQCLELVQTLYSEACDMERLAEALLQHLRGLLVLLSVREPRGFLLCTDEDYSRMHSQAALCSVPQLLGMMEQLTLAAAAMKRSSDRRMEMELALIRLCSGHTVVPAAPAVVPPAPSAPVAVAPPVVAAPVATPNLPHDAEPFAAWDDVLAKLPPMLKSFCAGSAAYFTNDVVVILSTNPSLKDLLKKDNNAETLKSAILDVTQLSVRLQVKDASPRATPNDPLALLAERV